MTEERAAELHREAAAGDAVLDARAVAQERARKAWRTRRAIATGQRAPMRVARARCVAVDGPFAGKTLLLDRALVAGDEWAIPGALYRFADAPGGRIAYIANSDPFLPVIGWRGWQFAHEAMGSTARRRLPLLQSGSDSIVWPGGAPLAAKCEIRTVVAPATAPITAETPVTMVPRHVDGAPAFDCSCGIYSTLTHHALGRAGHESDSVVGLLAGWGRIIEHADGYRFARAYPVLLVVTTGGWASASTDVRATVRELRATYGVPVAAAIYSGVHERVADYVAAPRADLPEWVYRALPPDLRAAGLEHQRAKKERPDG